MHDTADTAQVIIHPPIAWGLAVIAGLGLNWLVPLPFLPDNLPVGWLGAMVFVLALALGICSVVTIIRAGSNIPTNRPTTTIVESGPYRFTRNPHLPRHVPGSDWLGRRPNRPAGLLSDAPATRHLMADTVSPS
jgi:hypothetical protein